MSGSPNLFCDSAPDAAAAAAIRAAVLAASLLICSGYAALGSSPPTLNRDGDGFYAWDDTSAGPVRKGRLAVFAAAVVANIVVKIKVRIERSKLDGGGNVFPPRQRDGLVRGPLKTTLSASMAFLLTSAVAALERALLLEEGGGGGGSSNNNSRFAQISLSLLFLAGVALPGLLILTNAHLSDVLKEDLHSMGRCAVTCCRCQKTEQEKKVSNNEEEGPSRTVTECHIDVIACSRNHQIEDLVMEVQIPGQMPAIPN